MEQHIRLPLPDASEEVMLLIHGWYSDSETNEHALNQHLLYKDGSLSLCAPPAPISTQDPSDTNLHPDHIVVNMVDIGSFPQMGIFHLPNTGRARLPTDSEDSTTTFPPVTIGKPDEMLLRKPSENTYFCSEGRLIPHGAPFNREIPPVASLRKLKRPVYETLTVGQRRERFIAQSTVAPLGETSGQDKLAKTHLHGVLLRLDLPHSTFDGGRWVTFYFFTQSEELPVISSSGLDREILPILFRSRFNSMMESTRPESDGAWDIELFMLKRISAAPTSFDNIRHDVTRLDLWRAMCLFAREMPLSTWGSRWISDEIVVYALESMGINQVRKHEFPLEFYGLMSVFVRCAGSLRNLAEAYLGVTSKPEAGVSPVLDFLPVMNPLDRLYILHNILPMRMDEFASLGANDVSVLNTLIRSLKEYKSITLSLPGKMFWTFESGPDLLDSLLPPSMLGRLGAALFARFKLLQDLDDLKEAAEVIENFLPKEINLRNHNNLVDRHPYWFLAQAFLKVRATCRCPIPLTSEFLEYIPLAADLLPHSKLAYLHQNCGANIGGDPSFLMLLGASLTFMRHKYSLTGASKEESTEGIELIRRSLGCDEPANNKTTRIRALAEAYYHRFQDFADVDAIHKAITHFYTSLERADTLENHPQSIISNMRSLSRALSDRSALFQDLGDLENAIALLLRLKAWTETLAPEHQDVIANAYPHAEFEYSLSQLLVSRFQLSGIPDSIEEAVSLLRGLVSNRTQGAPPVDMLFHFGEALALSVFHLELPPAQVSATATEAIQVLLMAAETGRSWYTSRIYATLAALHTHQYFESGLLFCLDEALRFQVAAWESVPVYSTDRAQVQRQVTKLNILLAKERRISPDSLWLTTPLYEKCSKYLQNVTELDHAYARDKFGACQNWSQLVRSYAQLQHRKLTTSEQLEPYSIGMKIIPHLTTFAHSLRHRHQQLQGVGAFVRDAAAAAIRQAKYTLALEWLEQGRGVTWTQIHSLKLPLEAIRAAQPELGNRLEEISQLLRQASTGRTMNASLIPGRENAKYHDVSQERIELLRTLDALPDFKGMFTPTPFQDMTPPMRDLGFVVYLNISRDGCDALVIERTRELMKITPVPLPDFAEKDAKRLQLSLDNSLQRSRLARGSREKSAEPVLTMIRDSVGNVFDATGDVIRAYRSGKGGNGADLRSKSEETRQSPEEELELILIVLWLTVVEPIVTALELEPQPDITTRPRVWWCTTGSISFLPIHAAGWYTQDSLFGSRLSDYLISSYTPTLANISETRLTRKERCPKPSILAVAQPKAPGFYRIPSTLHELDKIKERAAGKNIQIEILSERSSTLEQVKAKLKDASWVHFACHGEQDIEPLHSALLVGKKANEELTLKTIVEMELPNAELAFLSACQTAKGDQELSDEVVHLAAGMLMAGFRGVIGTMWSMEDSVGPEIADEVYGYLFEDERPDSAKASLALQIATEKVRERKKQGLLSWVPFIHLGM